MLIKSVRGYTPVWGEDCFIAENATLIGDVVLGDQCSIWYQAVIRGDVHHIRIGDRVNIQDGAVIHATYKKKQEPLLVMMFLSVTTPLFTVVLYTIMF